MVFDLHTHSTCSDGTTRPAENVALAARAGLRGVALTDHDTTAGWDEAAQACDEHGVELVPGVELSTELGERGVHILGYWVDPAHPEFAAECDRLRLERERRAAAILARLASLGVEVSMDAVRGSAAGAPVG
ncbi:MAG: PHP domain-containing protein, partial [Euzebyales bacterium]|nr:PHP domain-containing protein [Euzebyales bacterium]